MTPIPDMEFIDIRNEYTVYSLRECNQSGVAVNMIFFLALFVIPYACFVFFGEGFNPFVRPRNPLQRKQWRSGRAMGLSAFLGIAIAFVLFSTVTESLITSMLVGIAIFAVLATIFSARRISEYFFG